MTDAYGPAAVAAFRDRCKRRSPSQEWELRQRWAKRAKERKKANARQERA